MTRPEGFAVWITGIPASGKSTLAQELVRKLNERGIYPAVLESDVMRAVLTPEADYGSDERDRFYRQLADIGAMLAAQGLPVIFDATANRKAYRDRARSLIRRFIEVYVQCPVETCRQRDPKGIYAAAVRGTASNVPGIQASYEPPPSPEVTVDGTTDPRQSADAILHYLVAMHNI
jgi:adenylylsulfate kinase